MIGVVYSLEAMASLYLMTGNTELAACLIGWADATREVIANMRPRLEQTEVDRLTTACRVNMGEAAFLEGYAAGKKLTLDEAMGLAFKGVE